VKYILLTLIIFTACKPAKLISESEPSPVQTSSERDSLRRINKISLGSINSPFGIGSSEIEKLFTEKFTSNAGVTIVPESNVQANITVTEFQDRVGSQVGATSPAVVRFSIQLVDSGKIVWSSGYSNSQGAISENLLSKDLKAEEGFSSARELLDLGFEKVSQELGAQRMKAFLK